MALDEWRQNLQQWRLRYPGPPLAVHDFDADGLTSAALWKLACDGELRVAVSRQTLPTLAEQPELIYLLDLSCPEERFPWDAPTIIIDHHLPPDRTPACLMLNSHDWQPRACTSLLTHWLFFGDASPHGWIAAVGALSDLGDGANFDLLQKQLEQWGRNKMRQLTSLINSAHRCEGDCSQAITALLDHTDPADLLRSDHPAVSYLRDCQQKVRSRMNSAKGAAPKFFGNLAVVQFTSDCPVQSIIAQIWRTRLPNYVILVANVRSDRPQVQLSARSKAPLSAIEILARRGLILRGHPGSAGAVLAPAQWQFFLESLLAHPN